MTPAAAPAAKTPRKNARPSSPRKAGNRASSRFVQT